MAQPSQDAWEIFDACVQSVGSTDLRWRLNVDRILLGNWYDCYAELAQKNELYQIPRIRSDDDLALDHVTALELKNLYSYQLVDKRKSSRIYYDKLLAAAHRGKCPFCGFGQASTLDHYLAKSEFPWFSIFPLNLIPACKDCNHFKSASVAATRADQCLHPYFNDISISNEQWLFAVVEETSPVSIRFYAAPPDGWTEDLMLKVKTHLSSFDLPRRFSIEASNEIAGLGPVLRDLEMSAGSEGVRSHLELISKAAMRQEPNSWKSALLQALAASRWYCDGGYRI